MIRADSQAMDRGSERADWKAVTAAILKRWPKGLARVKKLAWKELQS